MTALSGRSLGTGIALGTAAVVRLRNGLPVPPPIPPRIAAQLARHREDETPDVILIAEDYVTAASFASTIRWANVVGIAARNASPDTITPEIPVVVELPGLLDIVQDDMLVIVDARRGLLVVNPDGVTLSQYQAEHNNLAPKRRLYLDDGHLRAQTLDGRALPVVARVCTLEDVTLALENGADGLCVPALCDLLPAEADEEEQRTALFAVIDQASGKPVFLADNYTLPATLLVEAATKADIAVGCPLMPHLEGLGIHELGEELNEVRADCLARDSPCDIPRLVATMPSDYAYPLDDPEKAAFFMDQLVYNGAVRVVVTFQDSQDGAGQGGIGLDGHTDGHNNLEDLIWLDSVVAAANTTMLPVFVQWNRSVFDFSGDNRLDENALHTLQLLVGAGLSGVIAAAGDVAKLKTAISELSFSECREALSTLLSAARHTHLNGTYPNNMEPNAKEGVMA